MKQRVAVITLAVHDLGASLRFYCDGLGWAPAWRNDEVAFFQFNGFVFALWSKSAFEADSKTTVVPRSHAIAIAHNVEDRNEVDALMRLAQSAGATVLRAPEVQPWGGYSGYFEDLDGHVWEVAHNPVWELTPDGTTLFRQ